MTLCSNCHQVLRFILPSLHPHLSTWKHASVLAFDYSHVGHPVVSYEPPLVCILYLITFPLEMLIEMEHKSLMQWTNDAETMQRLEDKRKLTPSVPQELLPINKKTLFCCYLLVFLPYRLSKDAFYTCRFRSQL